jgi:hypothetical protein
MSNDVDEGLAIVWLALLGAIIISLFTIGVFALPFVLVGGGIFIAVKKHYSSEGYKERKAKEHTDLLYREAKSNFGSAPTTDEFVEKAHKYIPGDLPSGLVDRIGSVVAELYELENFNRLPEPPAICNSIEGARYRDTLKAQAAKDNTQTLDVLLKQIKELIENFLILTVFVVT